MKKPDPYAKREAEKYDRPIPSREFIIELLKEKNKPLNAEQLQQALKITEGDDLIALDRRLRAMLRDGQLIETRRGTFGLVDRMNLIRGRVIGHRDGFGFLRPEDGSEDLFLHSRHMRRVLHGDTVLVHISGIDQRGRQEAAIVEILERGTQQVVGRYIKEKGVAYVIPENKCVTQDVIIPPSEENGAIHEQIVVAGITDYPTARSRATGRILEVLGDHMAPGLEIDVAIRAHDIPHEWPQNVLDEADEIGTKVETIDKKDRKDLRHLALVTIDGEDAKDFDDAVYCEPRSRGGWLLYVAIADVSHYVKSESALDKEANKRGNSVYFPGKVVPMLPEILSNGICSLKPSVERLSMVCEMTINAEGRIKGYQFYSALIRSHARLTYNQVHAWLQGQEPEKTKHAKVLPHLKDLHALYLALRAQRDQRGAIDFETTETRIVFGEGRKIKEIVPVERNEAHRIIEECMLAANVCSAEFLLKHKIPALYRVHAGPTKDKLTNLKTFLGELSLKMKGGSDPKPKDFNKLLESIQERPDKHLIQTVMLRSLSQAVYQPENQGHFGLAYDAYTHFTSPIRRYPDLMVHRAIKHLLEKSKAKGFAYTKEAIQSIGSQCSVTERRADAATYDVMDWLKCEFMLDKLGNEYDGIITGVTAFGIFVELSNIFVEGLVHITSLNDDYYRFDAAHHRLSGQRSNMVYRLGDAVRIQVARVDLDEKQIDFVLPDGKPSSKKPRGKASKFQPKRQGSAKKDKPRKKSKTSSKPKASPTTSSKPKTKSKVKAWIKNKSTSKRKK